MGWVRLQRRLSGGDGCSMRMVNQVAARFGEWIATGWDDGMMGDRSVAAQRPKGKGRRLVGPPLRCRSFRQSTRLTRPRWRRTRAPQAHCCLYSAPSLCEQPADRRGVAVIGVCVDERDESAGCGVAPGWSPRSPLARRQCACRLPLAAEPRQPATAAQRSGLTDTSTSVSAPLTTGHEAKANESAWTKGQQSLDTTKGLSCYTLNELVTFVRTHAAVLIRSWIWVRFFFEPD